MASTDVFETILTSLRSGDDAVREKGLQNFQDFVRSSLASSKSDDQESFWKEIINRILFPLTATSDTPQEKLVGIAAIDKLLLSPSDDAHPTSAPASQSLNPSASSTSSTRSLLYRLLRYLKNLLPDPNLVVMMAASQTYGAIFRIGGAIVAETVGEMEIQHAVGLMSEVEGEWTGSKNRDLTIARLSQSQPTPTPTTSAKPAPPRPPREKILAPHARMAGVLILIQIATYAPHIYHQHVALILSRIMYPLRDPSRFLVPVSANNANNDLFPGGGQAGNILDSLSGIAGTLATGSGDNKLGVEAQDIVRRLAARLFGVTLAVIEGREPGLLEQAALNEEQALASKPAPKKRDTIALSPSAARLERTGTLSTIHQQQPLSPTTTSGSFRGPLRANEPLFNVATAASRDLLAYSSTELDHVDVRRLAPSASSSQSKGDINRAFGALLIFRELLESGLTSLAGVSLNNPSKYPGDKKRLVMERRGDDAPRGLVGHLDGFQPPSASTSTISTGISKSNSLQSPPPPNYGSSGSPMAALERPMTYPRLFGVIFKLALSHPSPAGHTSLLAASTHSIANLLMAPSSPIAPSPSSSTFVGTPSSFTAAGNAISSGSGSIGTGVGWSTPLPAFSKSETEDQLRKEALSLLPVCAAFDTETFKQGGFFRGTMYAILCAWGVESYSNSSSTQIGRPSGRNRHHHHHDEEGLGLFADEEGDEFVREERRDTERMVSSMRGKIPVETKDRSYLVRVVGELTFAMRRSNAMLSYIWELGVIFNGALESRVQPPFPWRYDNYYSEAATAARESSATKANPANRGGPTGSKRASTAIEALSISTGKGAPTIGERTSSSSSIKSGPRRGLGGKNGKAIVITRGSVSDEVLFEAIALLCTALGVHALKVLGIAGWKEGEDHGDGLGGEKEVDESEDVHRQAAITKMFRFGLNPALCASLPHISHNIAVSLKMLQEHLLNEISTILSGHGYQAPGAPETEPRVVTTYEEKGGSPTTKKKATSSALIKLGLACLQTFDWHGRILTPLIQDGVLLYLDSKDRDVRMEASLSICKLFMLDPIAHHTSTASVGIINQVVGRLVRVALADADPEIRALVLSNLDESYDRHLAQVEHIRALCMALNDEDAAVRMQAVPIVGRLAVRNPANVMPGLRVELIKILTELEYSTDAKAILTTAEVLTSLLKCTERLIKPYAPSLLRVCLPKARSPLPYVSRRMVQCIGLLAEIAADDIIPSLEEIMDLLISILQDPTASANKKDMALVSLGQVCSNTSNVIDPYVKYPDILPIFRRMLRSESSDRTKRKVLQVMGILGAIDPYIRQTIPEPESADKTPAAKALQQSVKTVGSQPETFYQSVVIQSLLSILADPSLVSNHPNVIEVLLAIFKTQGMKCVPFLPQIIPAFSSMCRATNAKHQDYYLQQMSIIIQIVGSHIRNFMREVFQLVTDLWVNPILHLPIVGLVESLSTAMAAEFKPYLPVVIPQLLTVFNETSGYEQGPTVIRVFQAILSFGSAVEDFLHLILPVLLSTIESAAAPLHTRKAAANTIASLSQRVSLADNTSRIVQSLVRTLTKAEAPLQMAIMDMLCLLMVQVGPDFALFIPRITDCMTQNNIQYPQFHHLAEILMRGEPLPQKCGADERWSKSGHMDPVASADLTRPTVNQLQLRRSWSLDRVVRQEDWPRWFKSFSLGLMGESTSQALRACVSLAASHDPLAKELFNAAFYSCWVELSEPNKDDLVDVLSRALRDSRNTEIRLRLLGVIEFMEHEDKPLPIDNRTLGDIAAQTNALAKALHYKEHEFLSAPNPEVVEQLIGINAQLKQRDAALGLLFNEQLSQGIERVLWYEQLGRWEQATELYKSRLQLNERDGEAVMGQMRCLHALSEWEALSLNMENRWPSASLEERGELAPMAASSAWVLRKWDRMDEYVASMGSDSTDRSFFKAILSVHGSQFDTAQTCIARARDALQMDLGIVDDYNRVYGTMVRIQLLSELEEIITYKKSVDQPDKKAMLRKTWKKRLQGCQHDVDTWQRVLQLRSLVISPSEDARSYIKFANLCRKEGRWNLAESVIQQLLADQARRENSQRASPAVVFAHLRLLWDIGDKMRSLGFLVEVCASLAHDIGLDDPRRIITGSVEEIEEVRRLLSRCYLKQGEWRQELQTDWTPEQIAEVIQCYHLATQLDPKWYKAWHMWALCNFEVINHLENIDDDRDEEVQRRALLSHIVEAVVGFFRSIALGGENPIQDSLRLLTLWFKFGADEEVSGVVADNFGTVSIDTWLEVIPQLIARIQTPSRVIRQQINSLLIQVGRVHPQALVYPLTVASKSNSQLRIDAAKEITDRLCDHSPILVEQAHMVSHELIRVAILWHELWHEYLEEASRLYFTEKKPEAMIEHLEILHRKLDQGPETTREESFVQVHGKDLREAREACHRYLRHREAGEMDKASADMDKAWDIYYGVFRRIEKQLPLLTTIDLQYVSPNLLRAEDLELAVPGTYKGGKYIVRIARFVPKLSVIASKQRPRRLAINGNDGKEYQYCLKGHEDLRQDERVMQVFSLVNTLLSADRQSFKRKLHIQGYAAIPLAPNVGVLRWVQHADTLHVLVSDYRQARKIHLQIEYRLMLQMAPDYVNLTMLQKLEVFKYALDNTTGQDLYRVLWLTSGDSESWLERRSTYTRSLAVSSMVGHILGLGDRHPANLLLDQYTGKVVHIDFGDCFEIAMHREKFPERVPFRLTRMLVSAMEVSGIDGSFKVTSEITMKVLRDNREPLMAVLEAFIYDPLVSWRLTTETDTRTRVQNAPVVTGGANAPAPGAGVDGDQFGAAAAAAYTRYAGGPRRRVQLNEGLAFNEDMTEWRNAKALEVYQRVQKKLTGRDFNPDEELTVEEQVAKLIKQATALENLCQAFPGWCPFW